MKRRKAKSLRRKYVVAYVLSFFVITISIVMAVLFFGYFKGSIKESTNKKVYDRYYTMIAGDRQLDFWRSVYEGAYERGLEQNAYVELLGENLPDNYTNVDLMKIALASDVDGIMISADESAEMTELINEAVQEGIPVVTVYNDNAQSSRDSFVGVGSYNLGCEYGRQVLKIVDAKPKNRVRKVLVLVNAYADNSSQNILCSGIQDTIKKQKKTYQQIELSLEAVDERREFSVEESIRDIFMKDDLPDVIICLNELYTTCVYQAVVDYNKVGLVDILGYYDSGVILNAIEREVIYATITADTKQMGVYSVDALTEINQTGNISTYFTADIILIDRKNVGEYVGGKSER